MLDKGEKGAAMLTHLHLALLGSQIQQLAAVEMRKRVGSGKAKLWAKQTPTMRSQIKAGLLQGLASGAATCVSIGVLVVHVPV